eukprot:gene20407-24345_t
MKFEHVDVSIRPSLSSLPLQMTLFYNCVFSVIFAILMGAALINKVTHYESAFGLAVFCIWAATEPVRLYYGIAGNLQESVAHLSTFLLMTIFPQLALILYLAYFQTIKYPVDSILGSFQFIFAILEVGFAWGLTKDVIKSQTAQFMRLVDHEE